VSDTGVLPWSFYADRDARKRDAGEDVNALPAVEQSSRPGEEDRALPGRINPLMRIANIGSAKICDVVVHDDPYVSGIHAQVAVDDIGAVIVRDAGSMNGTWIKRAGQPTPRHPSLLQRVIGWVVIRPGDTLWLSQKTAIPWDPGTPAPKLEGQREASDR
jgi:pSer/pThr/pTyr-binding forkhead associated (FHA) protein